MFLSKLLLFLKMNYLPCIYYLHNTQADGRNSLSLGPYVFLIVPDNQPPPTLKQSLPLSFNIYIYLI
ncbi:hypothetical protein XENTR_v10004494 [Xenopus tropicalis]|nr:hypothetical protein XENTR_v10004494 [Xenopus tropicalis]